MQLKALRRSPASVASSSVSPRLRWRAPPSGGSHTPATACSGSAVQAGIVEDAFWPGQAVMLAQHRSLVFSPEQPPLLEDRDHFGAKHVELRRQQWRHDIEPVGRTVLEPVLDKIGDLFGRAGSDVMSARAGKIPEQLPQCRLVAPHQIDDDFSTAARGLYQTRVGEIFRDKRAIEPQGRKIVPAEATRQPLAPDLRIRKIVDLARGAAPRPPWRRSSGSGPAGSGCASAAVPRPPPAASDRRRILAPSSSPCER